MGVYFLFMAYFDIFNMIGDGGFVSAAVKRISEGKDQNEYLTAYTTLRLLLIIVSTLLLLTIGQHFADLRDFFRFDKGKVDLIPDDGLNQYIRLDVMSEVVWCEA